MNNDPKTCGPEDNKLEYLDIDVKSDPVTSMSAFLNKLREGAARAITQEEGPYGNIYTRSMEFPDVGSTVKGHAHKYDHVTLILEGSVWAKFFKVGEDGYAIGEERNEAGDVIKQAVAVREQAYGKGSEILIYKNMAHEFTALEKAKGKCVFALRDADGNVTDQSNNDWVKESAD